MPARQLDQEAERLRRNFAAALLIEDGLFALIEKAGPYGSHTLEMIELLINLRREIMNQRTLLANFTREMWQQNYLNLKRPQPPK